MAQVEMTSFSRIVEHIKQLCNQRKTGTLFLVSDENHMVQVHLERGDIVSLAHRNRRGLGALAVLVQIKNAKLRFDEGYVASTENDDLSTKAIFDYLDKATQDSPKPVPAQGTPVSIVFSSEVRATAQRILMKYVGPMAEIVCADHFDRAPDLHSLARSLADEVPDQEQSAKFAVEIAAALNLMSA